MNAERALDSTEKSLTDMISNAKNFLTTSLEVFPAHSSTPEAKFVTLKMPFHGQVLVF